MASTWAAVTAAMGSGKGIPSSARTAISTAWAIRERSKGATRPSRLRTNLPMNRAASSDVVAGTAGSRIRLFVDLCPFLFEDHLALSALVDRSGNGHAGCLAGSGGDDGGTPRPPAAPESEPGTTTEPTAVPADDDLTRSRARGWDEERRQYRVSQFQPTTPMRRTRPLAPPAEARVTSTPLRVQSSQGVAQRQVFGLMGRPIALRVARPEVLVAVASQSERFGPVPLTAVVPTHRCGAAPDSHRVPC